MAAALSNAWPFAPVLVCLIPVAFMREFFGGHSTPWARNVMICLVAWAPLVVCCAIERRHISSGRTLVMSSMRAATVWTVLNVAGVLLWMCMLSLAELAAGR